MKCNEISETYEIKPTDFDSEVTSDLLFDFGCLKGKSLPKSVKGKSLLKILRVRNWVQTFVFKYILGGYASFIMTLAFMWHKLCLKPYDMVHIKHMENDKVIKSLMIVIEKLMIFTFKTFELYWSVTGSNIHAYDSKTLIWWHGCWRQNVLVTSLRC